MGNLFDHLVARGDVLKNFQLSQKVVRKLHIGDALVFFRKFWDIATRISFESNSNRPVSLFYQSFHWGPLKISETSACCETMIWRSQKLMWPFVIWKLASQIKLEERIFHLFRDASQLWLLQMVFQSTKWPEREFRQTIQSVNLCGSIGGRKSSSSRSGKEFLLWRSSSSSCTSSSSSLPLLTC